MSNESSGLTKDDLAVLGAKFKEDEVQVKVNSFSKDRTKAMLVLYLQHTDVYSRLDSVDPNWSSQCVGVEKDSEVVYCKMRLTIKGITRENVGDGKDIKGAYSDALKRAAMLFGVGRYLYDVETVWVPYNESTDRFKKYTLKDFRAAY